MLDLFKAVVLGVLQGLTEFLPISSSAHLRIYPELFGWEEPGAAFTAGLSIFAASLITKRSRVAQCTSDETLSSPPTPLRTAAAVLE